MSLSTWKEEFYLFDAAEVSEEDALQHSHRKWIGLRPENLAKHGVFRLGGKIVDDGYIVLDIDDQSCALCVHHADNPVHDYCTTCPLYRANYDTPCDQGPGQYQAFTKRGDPEPMIALIEKAISSTVVEATTTQPNE